MIRTRFRKILFFFAGVTFNFIFWDIILARLGLRSVVRRNRPKRFRKAARRFRSTAVEMGGVMIKVGQFLSSRLDVLPREITIELAGLQDEVYPETFSDIRRELEKDFKVPLEEKFSFFEESPMASASIGQAHRARLRVDRDVEIGSEIYPSVVVKIQRPNIENIIETDLAALRIVSGWLDRYPPIRKHANVPGLLRELDLSIHEEMDYLQEGKNADTFRENFKGDDRVRVPRIFWEWTTKKVITLEDVQAIKITDYQAIEEAGIDRAEVAQFLLETYLIQVLEHRFFHADPHPGNLFIMPEPDPDEGHHRRWKLVFVDFGMVGHITPVVMDGMREVIIAVSTGDAARLVRADQKLQFLLPGADLQLLERAYARVFERMWGKSTRDMVRMHKEEAGVFVREFSQLIYDMPFQFPEDLILLGRCFSILSGMCSGLNPDFNFWTSLGPYAQKLVEQEAGNRLQFWLKELLSLLSTAATLPKKMEGLILHLEQGKLQVDTQSLNKKIAHLENTQGRIVAAILFGSLLLASVQLYLAGRNELAWVGGSLAGVCLLAILLRR